MTPRELLDAFDVLAEAPNGIARLRELVLQLAVRGKLVPQDPTEYIAPLQNQSDSDPKEDSWFPVPASWRWARLGELLKDGPSNGWSPRAADHVTNIKTLKLSATTRGEFDAQHFKYVDASAKDVEKYWLEPDDILIQRSNTPEYVGIAARFDGPVRTFIYPDLMMRCRVTDEVLPSFVHYSLNAPYSRAWFRARASGTSQSMVKLNQANVRSAWVPVPPLAEQARIVARVDELRALIGRFEQTRLRRETARIAFRDASLAALGDAASAEDLDSAWRRVESSLDLVLQRVEDVAVVLDSVHDLASAGMLSETLHDDEPAGAMLLRVRDERRTIGARQPKSTPRFEARKGWVRTTVEDAFLSVTDGDHQAPPKSPTGVPFLVIGNISSGRIEVEGCRRVPREYFEQLDWTKRPKRGDILFSVTGSLGIAVLVDSDFDFCVQRHIAILKPARASNSEYLRLAVSSPRARRYAASEATGIAQKTLSLAALRAMPIDLPPRAEQERIVARFKAFESMLSRLQSHLSAANQHAVSLGQAVFASLGHSPQG